MVLRLLFTSLAMSACGIVAGAHAPNTSVASPDGPYVKPRLLAEHINFTPGKRSWLALEFAIAPGWHMYWKGQNDSGMPPQIEFQLPEGFKVGEVLWPAPERHTAPGDIVDSIVHEQMTLLIPVDVPVNAQIGSQLEVGVSAQWLVCKEACVMEDAALQVSLPVRNTMPAAELNPKATGVFASARERVPRNLPKENPPATIEWRNAGVTVHAAGASRLTFHPEEGGVALESPLSEGTAKSGTLVFRTKTTAKAELRLLGVLEIQKTGKKSEFYCVSLPQPGIKKPG